MQLRKFQVDALDAVGALNRCAFYYGMGLGKTFMGSEKAVRADTPRILIVCQKSKIQDWIDHMNEHYGDIHVLNLRQAKQRDLFCSNAAMRMAGVINYDILSKNARYFPKAGMAVIYDESSMLKNPTAARTKAAMALSCDSLVLLSGTPVGGKYEELWSQARMLGWPITKKEFYERFIVEQVNYLPGVPMPIKTVVGYRNVPELKSMLRKYGALFKRTDEVIDLPGEVDTDIKVPDSAEYRSMKTNGFYRTKSDNTVITANGPLHRMLLLRQLSSSFSEEKLAAFRDLVESTRERLIVFYNFEHEWELIRSEAAAAGRGFSYVNGRGSELYDYNNKAGSITAIQYQAGAMGLNLQKANQTVYFSPTLSYDLYAQSRARTRRMGQDRTCFYWHLVTRGLEERIYSTLKKREDYTLELFNNGI